MYREHDKLNKIGDFDGSLSYSWFNRNKGTRNSNDENTKK